jgi:hypothetical protein
MTDLYRVILYWISLYIWRRPPCPIYYGIINVNRTCKRSWASGLNCYKLWKTSSYLTVWIAYIFSYIHTSTITGAALMTALLLVTSHNWLCSVCACRGTLRLSYLRVSMRSAWTFMLCYLLRPDTIIWNLITLMTGPVQYLKVHARIYSTCCNHACTSCSIHICR